MALNINSYIKAEAAIKTHRFQKSKNYMVDDVPPTILGGYLTKTSSYDACITDKLNMHQDIYLQTSVYFPNKILNQYKPPSLSEIPTLQVGQYVTHIDSNWTQVLSIITKVMIFSVSGGSMYLIEGTYNQNHQSKIGSHHGSPYLNIFFIDSTI